MSTPTYTFDDILLVPQYSEITSRADVSIESWLTRGIILESPIISANMDTVTEHEMAYAMRANGGVGIIHRFMSIEDQANEVRLALEHTDKGGVLRIGGGVGAAVGANDDYLERALALKEAGAAFLCLDVAHGHTKVVGDALRTLVKETGLDIIAGNVATGEGTLFLIENGAAAVKVGIGPGSACLTRVVAGVGIPQFSAIIDCALAAAEHGIPIIADGGIRYPGDVAKAIAAGASTVMVGNLLARTVESPGQVIETPEGTYKTYRGMASRDAMEKKDKAMGSSGTNMAHAGRVTPEGVSGLVPFDPSNTVESVISEITGGLRSAMSYSNSMDIETFQKSAQFVTITRAGAVESGSHDVIV